MRLLKIIRILIATYFLSWSLLAAVGLSNSRTEALIAFGQGIIFFIKKILGFPLNLFNSEYPFLMDQTGKMLESDMNPIVLIAVNFILQVVIIYWILKMIKKPPTIKPKLL